MRSDINSALEQNVTPKLTEWYHFCREGEEFGVFTEKYFEYLWKKNSAGVGGPEWKTCWEIQSKFYIPYTKRIKQST